MTDTIGNPEPHESENTVFNLDERLLAEYPEMVSLSGFPVDQAPTDTWAVSAGFVNGPAIDRFIDNAVAGESTGDVGYMITFVGECLEQLRATGRPEYARFITEETKKLNSRKGRAAELIGWRQRGNDGVYK